MRITPLDLAKWQVYGVGFARIVRDRQKITDKKERKVEKAFKVYLNLNLNKERGKK